MASPQTSKGYARLANELAEAIYRFPFSGQELRVVMWTLRHSFGWSRRDTPPTSVRALAAEVRFPVATAGWVLRGLTSRGILLRMQVSGGLRLNKNYDEWLTSRSRQLPLTANTRAKSAGASDAPARAKGRKAEAQRAAARAEFARPAIADVQKYCADRRSKVDPDKFWHHYEANGWRTGRHQTPVTNWKSLVCYWERTNYNTAAEPADKAKPCPLCESPLPYPTAIVCHKCGARCRACGLETAQLKIVKRLDKTNTAVCAKGCPRSPSETAGLTRAAMPKAAKSLEEQQNHDKFMADHRRMMAAKERK